MNLRIPNVLFDIDGEKWVNEKLLNKDPFFSPNGKDYFYAYSRDNCHYGAAVNPIQIETSFSKKGRETPTQEIVQQGRWECGPASLSMMLNIPLWDVKRSLVKVGWNNDNYGVSSNKLIKAAHLLGFDIMRTLNPKDKPCLITVQSLNIKSAFHAVYFNGNQLLDPNYEKEGRNYYGVEWGPSTIRARGPFLAFRNEELVEFFPKKK